MKLHKPFSLKLKSKTISIKNTFYTLLLGGGIFINTPLHAQDCTNCSGDNANTFVGYYSGENMHGSAAKNTFIGYNSGNKTTTGNYNAFLGYKSGYSNTTGSYNVFLGYDSGKNNGSASNNTYIGTNSGYGTDDSSYTPGTYNTFIGYKSGYSNTTGEKNTFVGYNSGTKVTNGTYNAFLGYNSGANTTGGNNTFIGGDSGYYNKTGSYNVFLGRQAGYNETGSNMLYIANSPTANLIYGDFSTGQVGINTTTLAEGYTLSVNGSIMAVGLEIQPLSDWPDYVFRSDYPLMPLREVAAYVKKEQHLPGVPSEAEIKKEGLNVAEMDALLLKKIEELTLYLIQQDEKIQEQSKKIEQLQAQLNKK